MTHIQVVIAPVPEFLSDIHTYTYIHTYIHAYTHTYIHIQVVIAPVPESPAERAGIKPLDRVIRIDNIDVADMKLTPDEALSALRGRQGSTVEVLIRSARNSVGAVRSKDDLLTDR